MIEVGAFEAKTHLSSLLEHLRDTGALVPNLWHLEVGNVLIQAEKRG
jgi:hypothetical protein